MQWKKIDNCFKVNYEIEFLDKEIDIYDGITGTYNHILINKKSPIIRKGFFFTKAIKMLCVKI